MPVQITPLILRQLPIERRGLTEFTYSRFLVPYLSGYVGTSLFLDADMVVTDDIKKLFDCADPANYSVQVMQEQQKFEWASAMLFNNACCRILTPEFVNDGANKMFDLAWARDRIGPLPPEWNHCVGYMEPKTASLYHYTQGLPVFPECRGLPEDEAWQEEAQMLSATVPWKALMGKSVHAEHVLRRMFQKYTQD